MLDLQADRAHELERLVHDLIRHLRFADDVVQQRLRVRRVGHGGLALQQPRHHFDARERVLHFVRDGGRHLAERHEAIAQALALFELLDFREVLEEQRDAGRAAVLVAHVRQRVADHFAGRLQPQLGAVGQVAQLERAVQHAHHVGMFGEHLARSGGRRVRAVRLIWKMRAASAFISATLPSRVIASTPLRMPPTRRRKKRSDSPRVLWRRAGARSVLGVGRVLDGIKGSATTGKARKGGLSMGIINTPEGANAVPGIPCTKSRVNP